MALPSALNSSYPESRPVTSSFAVHFRSLLLLFSSFLGLLSFCLLWAIHHAQVPAQVPSPSHSEFMLPLPLSSTSRSPSVQRTNPSTQPGLGTFGDGAQPSSASFLPLLPSHWLVLMAPALAFIFPGTLHTLSRLCAFVHAVPSVRDTPRWSTWHPSSVAQLCSCQLPSFNLTPTKYQTVA